MQMSGMDTARRDPVFRHRAEEVTTAVGGDPLANGDSGACTIMASIAATTAVTTAMTDIATIACVLT
jgi:hypothetical protein